MQFKSKGCLFLLRGKRASKICKCSWSKEVTKVRRFTKAHKVLLVNYLALTPLEKSIFGADLLYKHMAENKKD